MNCDRRAYNEVQTFAFNSTKVLKRNLVVWKDHLSCRLISCYQFENLKSIWAKCINSVLLEIIHLLFDCRSYHKLKNYHFSWTEYLNINLLEIVHLYCCLQSWKQLLKSFSESTTVFKYNFLMIYSFLAWFPVM